MTTIESRYLAAFIATGFLLVGCGLGGPGDNKAPDAAVWFDAAVDSGEIDGGEIDSDVEVDADVATVQSIDATTLRYQEIPYVMGQTYIDLREPANYHEAHIPHAANIPEGQLWDGNGLIDSGQPLLDEAPVQDLPLFFYHWAASQATVEAIAQAAIDMGYSDVYVLEGGLDSWRDTGFYEDITTQGILAFHYGPIPATHYIVDTMDATSYEQDGHITGAINLDTTLFYENGQLIDGGQVLLDAIPCSAEAIIFYCINEGCPASEKACEAAELLECYFPSSHILHYPGGLEEWQAGSYPVSCGPTPDGPCP
jgi:rhodanese-related sulfurtransferase